VSLVKYPLGGPATVLVAFPKGIDVSSSYVDDTSGTPTIYYSKGSCTKNSAGNYNNDVYKIVD
jgi:hypothetical protein